jgi:hypothetical protein
VLDGGGVSTAGGVVFDSGAGVPVCVSVPAPGAGDPDELPLLPSEPVEVAGGATGASLSGRGRLPTLLDEPE